VRTTRAEEPSGFRFAVTHVSGLFCNASAKYALEPRPLSLRGGFLPRSIRQPLAACRHLAEAKNIEVLCEEGEEIYLWADVSHLNRLWPLLLDNAIKYTPRGGRIVVRTYADSTGAPVCEIVDTGIGIAARDLPNIFYRFFRAENARLAADVGLGLGLAIARWIVDVHEASLSVESTLGAGSTFRVKFLTQKRLPAGEGLRQDAATSLAVSVS
jgi:two-component system, OmpR family, phosphate regulon sensor histidine kinase PhoR